jgi:S-(hydroxymethyl)glutathione dehydrogenase / alcohol dehydrogenase
MVATEPAQRPARASAAVFDGAALRVVDDLDVAAPGEGEVTVRILASGICASDLHVLDGSSRSPLPVVLGHEGAGVVERVGPGVDGWVPGDPVSLQTVTPCGSCPACRRGHPTACAQAFGRGGTPLSRGGQPIRAYANVGSFSERTTVAASQLVGVAGLDPTSACLLGCAVSTGVGTIRNVARVTADDRVAVIGIGGIGANAVQAARLAGAVVTAVDVDPGRRAVAERFGAAAFLLADELAGHHGGFDVVVECSGAPAAIDAAIALTAPGGTTALVGLPPDGHRASFDVKALMSGRSIVGAFNGDTLPARDLPPVVEQIRRGELDIAGLVGAAWPLEEIADAVAAVRAGEVLRAVVDLSAGRRPGRRVPAR